MGYFPQAIRNEKNLYLDINHADLFPFGDRFLDAMIDEGLSIETIINKISKVDFIDIEEVHRNIDVTFEELHKRESMVDIKISDYIHKHYAKEQLFFSPNHPNLKLIFEYGNRILKFLGYPEQEISPSDVMINIPTLKCQDVPIYPSIKEAIGLEKFEKYYYPNRYFINGIKLEFLDYIKLYIYSRVNITD